MEPHTRLNLLLDRPRRRASWSAACPVPATPASTPGGALVKLKGKEILFLDPTAPLPDQVAVVAGCLRGRAGIEQRFLPPEVRQAIDNPESR